MVSIWILSRFRSAWLSENTPLLVLRLLRESTLSEWEILSRLHLRYGLNPSAREFGRLEKVLLRDGYAGFEPGLGENKLLITTAGLRLLLRLEEEYRAVVSNVKSSSGAAPSSPQT